MLRKYEYNIIIKKGLPFHFPEDKISIALLLLCFKETTEVYIKKKQNEETLKNISTPKLLCLFAFGGNTVSLSKRNF